uniref:Putative secreted protein 94 n=1 Tax=Amblyomma parvum TaxID=251391 RepID=A0A023FZ25_AMBPA
MILATIFIVGFGLCAGKAAAVFTPEKLNSTQLFRRSVNMVRTKDDLHLRMFSSDIKHEIPKCLVSRFLKRNNDKTYRTLEVNNIVESKEIVTDQKLTGLKTNVSIIVKKGDPPFFQATFEGGAPPESWKTTQYVKYAKPGWCLILGSSRGERLNPHCTLWGPVTCTGKCWLYCQMTFVEKCSTGVPVHLTQCTQTNVEKGGSKPIPK